MKRKGLALLMTTSMVLSLAACSNNSSSTGTTGAGTTQQQEQRQEQRQDQTTESSGTTAKGQETITIALWDYDTVGYDKTLVETFETAYPEYKVNVISVSNNDYGEKLTVMLAGGEDIDVFYGKGAEGFASLISRGNVLPLDEYIARDHVDISAYGDLVNLYSKNADGQICGLPYRTSMYMMFYNKTIFDQAGVAYPDADMTWEEYETLAKELTSGTGSEKIYGAFNIPQLKYSLARWAQKFNGTYTAVDGDLELLRAGLEMDYRMSYEDKTAMDYASCKSMNADQYMFYNGNVAMMFNGSWFVQMLAQDKGKQYDFEWGAVPMPSWEGGEKKSYATVTNVAINAKSKNPDAAWELTKFITGEEGAKIMASLYMLPGCVSDSVIEVFENSADIPEGVTQALTAEKVFVTTPATDDGARIQKLVLEEGELYLTQNQDLDTTIANMIARREE